MLVSTGAHPLPAAQMGSGGGGLKGGAWRGSVLRELDAHLAVALGIVGPVLAHLDEEEEVDGLLGERGDLLPRGDGDALDGLAALADDDLLLALALDIDG